MEIKCSLQYAVHDSIFIFYYILTHYKEKAYEVNYNHCCDPLPKQAG